MNPNKKCRLIVGGSVKKLSELGLHCGASLDVYVLMTGPNVEAEKEKLNAVLKCYPSTKVLVHLADEYCSHGWAWEFYNNFKLVLRQYACWDHYKKTYNASVMCIPLGYNKEMLPQNTTSILVAQNHLKKIKERMWAWAFAGTLKQNRKAGIDAFSDVLPNPHQHQFRTSALHTLYGMSHFVLSGRGNMNIDCFRIYEAALEGAIPVIECDASAFYAAFAHYTTKPTDFVWAPTWGEAKKEVKSLLANQFALKNKHIGILRWWVREVSTIANAVQHALQ